MTTHIHSPGHRLDDRGLYHHHSHHGPSSSTTEPSTGNDARSSNPDVARAAQVAGLFGLKPVGWVVARPGGKSNGWECGGCGKMGEIG